MLYWPSYQMLNKMACCNALVDFYWNTIKHDPHYYPPKQVHRSHQSGAVAYGAKFGYGTAPKAHRWPKRDIPEAISPFLAIAQAQTKQKYNVVLIKDYLEARDSLASHQVCGWHAQECRVHHHMLEQAAGTSGAIYAQQNKQSDCRRGSGCRWVNVVLWRGHQLQLLAPRTQGERDERHVEGVRLTLTFRQV